MKYIIALLAMLTFGVGNSLSSPAVNPLPPERPYYSAGEFNLDLYGTASIKNEHRDPDDVDFGLGVGGTYFFTPNFGLGVRAESESTAHSVFDFVGARVTLRAPLKSSFAPYGFVQGGYLFERDNWEAGAGGGLEYRFGPHFGVFGEAGLHVDDEGTGKMRGAAGVRLTF